MLDYDCPWDSERVAYHEASHAVTGLGLGLELTEILIRKDCTGTTRWNHPNRAKTPALYQRLLPVIVAGTVGEVLLHEALEGPCDRRDATEAPISRLLSHRLSQGPITESMSDTDVNDAEHAWRYTHDMILMRKAGLSRADYLQLSMRIRERDGESVPRVGHKEVVAEIVRAERWAEQLLSRKWKKVEAVALTLLAHPRGRLTAEEVRAVECAPDVFAAWK